MGDGESSLSRGIDQFFTALNAADVDLLRLRCASKW